MFEHIFFTFEKLMTIDLKTAFNLIKEGLGIIQTLAVITASIFASLGFNQWRREIIERRKIELAEEVTHLFSRFPNVISSIRSPLSFEKEGLTVVEDGKRPNLGHIALERLSKNDDFFREIDAIRYRFLAYFGQDKDTPFDNGREILHEIRWAAIPLANEDPGDYTAEERQRYEAVIMGMGDDLQKRAEQIRDDILKICSPYFK